MTNIDFQLLKTFTRGISYDPRRKQLVKARASLAYSMMFPDECIAVAGGAFDTETEGPYKGFVFTPVGVYNFDTGDKDPKRYNKTTAIGVIHSWNCLPHKPIKMSVRELIGFLKKSPEENRLGDVYGKMIRAYDSLNPKQPID